MTFLIRYKNTTKRKVSVDSKFLLVHVIVICLQSCTVQPRFFLSLSHYCKYFETQTNNMGWKSIRVEDATIVNWTLTLLLRSSVHSVNIIIMVWVINRGGGICGPYHVLTGLTFSLLFNLKAMATWLRPKICNFCEDNDKDNNKWSTIVQNPERVCKLSSL